VSDGEGEERDKFRPRIGGRGGEVPQERVPRFRNQLLARIARIGSASVRASSRAKGTPSARDVRRPAAYARRCVVKARFVPMNAYGKRAAALHLAYVEREGVEPEGSPGRLYGQAGTSAVHEALSAPIEGEKRQFRLIVSPEDGAETDLTAFTRRFMAQVEADLGRPLLWGAVNHWNTDNPHVHIVIRGVDHAGRDLTIDGRYLAEGMRGRAQEILTNELGPRTELHINDQRAREVRQERFTSLDRTLQACQEPGGVLLETRLPLKDQVSGSKLIARLGYLERLGLVTRFSAVEWTFREDWVETLRGLGQAKDIIKRMYAAVPVSDPSRLIFVDGSAPLAAVEGVVRRKGLHDELSGRPFAIVETVDGRAFYAPIDLSAAEKIAEGDIVRLAVETPPRRAAEDPADAASGTSARLRVRLQHLAAPLRAQVGYRGPTWVDTAGAAAPENVGGAFAREVEACLDRRGANVKAMGIDTNEPAARMRALIALEARGLGARLAGERGVTLMESSAQLKGTLTLAPKLPSGRQCAVVIDDESKRLWVLPATKQLRLLEGQQVESRRTQEGRLVLSRSGPERTRGYER
jgi:type IV secretory pathway VirD2 relaxase